MNHIMLSSIGTSEPRYTEYELDGNFTQSRICAFALRKLLPEEKRPDKVLFFLTPKANAEAINTIKTESEQYTIEFDIVNLSSEDALNDSADFLKIVSNAIPKGSRITLDLTGGLRHHAFLLFTLSLYLGEFRGIDIDGAWYCRYEITGDSKPFIDLKPVLELSSWFHALGVFKETGSLFTISRLLDNKYAEGLFQNYSSFFLTGMPLEAGKAAALLVNKLKSSSERDVNLLPNMPLIEEIKKKIVLELIPLLAPNKKKPNLLLDEKELERQATFIDKYLATDQLNLAFGLMREWVVNKILLARGEKLNWLKHKEARQPVEHLLGGMQAIFKSKAVPTLRLIPKEQIKWAKFWDDLTRVRNKLQHHGMNPDVFSKNWKMVENLKQIWPEVKKWSPPSNFGGAAGKILICPLGQTPGVLFSALTHVQPNRCLIVCSKDTEISAHRAVRQADWPGSIEYLIMENPHTGFAEFSKLKEKASLWLFEADSVHACITGGTSLMGALVGELAYYAGRTYQRDVQKFVLIDRRSPVEQQEIPWVKGEIQYLEKNEIV